jgi:hypothetical protein
MFSTLHGRIFGKKSATNKSTNLPDARSSTAQDDYRAPEFNIDDYKPMKVRCIGAGFSGILCALRYAIMSHGSILHSARHHINRFRQKIANLDFKIYEKQGGIGGTWYANRYPVGNTQYVEYPMFILMFS